MTPISHRVPPLLAIALSVLLSACGFHLREGINLPPNIEPLYISGASDQLGLELRNALTASGIELSEESAAARHILRIGEQHSDKRSSALG